MKSQPKAFAKIAASSQAAGFNKRACRA